jgi:hypothetical protein
MYVISPPPINRKIILTIYVFPTTHKLENYLDNVHIVVLGHERPFRAWFYAVSFDFPGALAAVLVPPLKLRHLFWTAPPLLWTSILSFLLR